MMLLEDNKPIKASDPDEYELKQKLQEKKKAKLECEDPLYEQLGFVGNMPYKARKEVRSAC